MGPQEERILVCPDLVPVAGMRDREQLGEATVSLTYTLYPSPPLKEVRGGTQRQGLKAETVGDAAYQLAFPFAFIYFSYTSQDHLPKHGTSHGGLGPSTIIINQDNALQLAYRPI